MSKTIVTHFNPDLDALTSIWLINRFFPGWEEAAVKFISAGKTLNNGAPDTNPEVTHVDTGGGKFDHHQDEAREPACAQVLKELERQNRKLTGNEALKRLVDVVVDADVGNYIHWPESQTDRYEFSLDGIIGGLKRAGLSDSNMVEAVLSILDGIYAALKCKVGAERILKTGLVFETKWGQGVGFETQNDMVLDLGEKAGYSLVVRKDPKTGGARIYARNDRGVDLTPVWEKLRQKDPEATWFLHQSKCLLLNGSSKNPEMKMTKLSLGEVIEALTGIK